MVTQANSNLVSIRKKFRRATATSGANALSDDDVDQYINDFYNSDFPAAIKTDQMRGVYTFFTAPNQDRYPIDVNYQQSFRAPVYFEGIQGSLYKNRQDFFTVYPRFPTKITPTTGDGMTQTFNFTLTGAPLLPNEVVVGTQDISGLPIQVNDDGNGLLYLQTPNAQTSIPAITNDAPGMYNLNTGNPGQNILDPVGTVNYLTGFVTLDFQTVNLTPADAFPVTVWVNQYQAGRPHSLLYWNNEIQVRPVPDGVYKVEIETYMTPVQFMSISDEPIVNGWWQYIALGAALRYLQDIQDMEGVENVRGMFLEQEALVLERQANEEIGTRNGTLYTSPQGGGNRFSAYGYY